ncbi:STAS domain-containing protein [Bosea sp. BH3]|uniref:STAS domain-containing protein n=1 Tax=Bosea sp. BH3 TaxID=2871701 RepID=UPI002A687BD5|nr:STAS domain-containing protein [Bosea sp. BH3]
MANDVTHSVATSASIALPTDCTIRGIAEIVTSSRNTLASGQGLTFDCSAVETADITFVQFAVSASRSAAASGLPIAFESVPEPVLAAFARAGVTVPDALPGTTFRS